MYKQWEIKKLWQFGNIVRIKNSIRISEKRITDHKREIRQKKNGGLLLI